MLHSCAACRILVPQPGIEPVPPAVEARSLNHWTAREVPIGLFLQLICRFKNLQNKLEEKCSRPSECRGIAHSQPGV